MLIMEEPTPSKLKAMLKELVKTFLLQLNWDMTKGLNYLISIVNNSYLLMILLLNINTFSRINRSTKPRNSNLKITSIKPSIVLF